VSQIARYALVTGSCGLVGSEASLHFARNGYEVVGVDNNERAVYFGPEGDTSWSLKRLRHEIPGYQRHPLDIRNREGVLKLVDDVKPHVIVRTAAQLSHDRAAQIAFDDFDTNAVGRINLLEAVRRSAKRHLFHMSTNKV
jgi:CDP-paratose 2-epimerase